jgi:hypothetical protein
VVTNINPPVEGHDPRNCEKFSAHMSASAVRRIVSDKVFNDYYSFCFERNPFDKVLSGYRWQRKSGGLQGSFRVYIFKCFYNHLIEALNLPGRLMIDRKKFFFPSDWDTYTCDGEFIVDEVKKYENLEDDLAEVLKKINVDVAVKLTNQKKTSPEGNKNRSPEDDYDFISRAIVRFVFRRELTHFGYQ